jgi:RNA polymerase sigma factor (sigma-70 family)
MSSPISALAEWPPCHEGPNKKRADARGSAPGCLSSGFVVTSKALFQTYIVGIMKVVMRANSDDAALVADTLGGDPEAFGCIVARYQALMICSLAYSATGSLSQGEDIAQETFVAAWRQLRDLREPAKLRAWLCRIARNRICDTLRERERDPVSTAEPLEGALDFAAPQSWSPDQAITHEEEAILWRSLQRIPQTYRDPLVLFYREHHSIEQVANNLELSQDAVKQRLARGRKLLHKEVLAFVEGALTRTKPGETFTNRVLTALPGLTISAKAVGIGATGAQAGGMAKTALTAVTSGAVFGPALGILGAWIGYRVGMRSADSDERREGVRSFYRECLAWMAVSLVAIALPLFLGRQLKTLHPELAADTAIGLALVYVAGSTTVSLSSLRKRRKLPAHGPAVATAAHSAKTAWEYRSHFTMLGLPLIHICAGGGHATTAKAWIAVGDVALGLLVAVGGVTIAPLSIGSCAIGLLALGGCAAGPLAVGGLSLGVWSFGGLALGWRAFGVCAIGWNAAAGGVALARDLALGIIAHAAQANSSAAQSFVSSNRFFRISGILSSQVAWLNLLWVFPAMTWCRFFMRRGHRVT